MRGKRWLSLCRAQSCLLSKAMGPNIATDSMGLLVTLKRLVAGPCSALALALWLVHFRCPPACAHLCYPLLFLAPGDLSTGQRAQVPHVTAQRPVFCPKPRVGGTRKLIQSVELLLFLGVVHYGLQGVGSRPGYWAAPDGHC